MKHSSDSSVIMGSEKSIILSRFKSKEPSFFCTQLKKRAVPLCFILILPLSRKESFHSVRKFLQMVTEVWHYRQWLEQGLKKEKKKFKRVQIPPKLLLLSPKAAERRRSLFRSQQPDRITPAPSPTACPADLQGIAKTWGIFFSSVCQESVTQQRGCQARISLTQSDNTSNGWFFSLAERHLPK